MLERRTLVLALSGAAVTRASRAQTNGQLIQPARFSNAPLGQIPPGYWRHQTLPNVERANDFAIVADEGNVLHGVSSASASSWATPLDLNPMAAPVLRWSWRVQRSLLVSDFMEKGGDDYAARVYVFFDLPTERLRLGNRLRLAAAQLQSRQPLPKASICYVWGGPRQAVGSSSWNPYTEAVRMIVVDSGDTHAGHWRCVQRDLRLDWRVAFGGAAPQIGGVAVGLDTDNSGGEAQAWFGDIMVEAE